MSILYQLASGKVIKISIEDFLNMNDEVEQYLISQNAGDTINSPWHDSSIKNSKRVVEDEDDFNDLDFYPDSDDVEPNRKIDLNNIPDEEPNDTLF